MTIPYTYLIGWPELNTWYYGVRYAEGCHPDDLWTTYFTSSKYVSDFVTLHGEPTYKKIRRLFTADTIPLAKLWEHRVLRRMKVVHKKEWLNKNDRMAPPILSGDTHPSKTHPDWSEKQSAWMTTAWKNMDPVTRENHRINTGLASKNNWATMSSEEYDRISKLRSDNQIKIESEKTIERKNEIAKTQSKSAKIVWENRTEEVKQSHSFKIKKEMNIRVSCVGCHDETNRTALTRFHKKCLEIKNDF